MKHFSHILRLAFIFTVILLNLNCTEKEGSPEFPNIILVMADDQGWGDMAYNGHPVIQTPNFDNLAASGLRFDRFYAAAPVCSPTRGSILTGRHPNRFGCFTWGKTLRPQEITIAEVLKSMGYITGHFGKWHLGSVQKGSPVNPGASGFDEWFSAPNFFDNNPILSREGKAVQTTGESSMVTMDAALEFIRKHLHSGQPIFTVVWFGSPHNPHHASDSDSALYAGLSPELCNFYGEITGMDRAVGKLREEIKNMGIRENTLLWYCSDNGGLPNIGTTGGRGHKADIYEGGLRVPAIIEWPAKLQHASSTNIPANTTDIYPTLLEIVGATMNNQPVLDGISLLPVIEGKMNERSKPIGFWQYPGPGRGVPSRIWMAELLQSQQEGIMIPDSSRLDLDAEVITVHSPVDSFPGHAAWLDWPWKLHRIQNKNGDVELELYNLKNDSLEQNNLTESISDKVESMLPQLEAWQESVVRSLNGEDYN